MVFSHLKLLYQCDTWGFHNGVKIKVLWNVRPSSLLDGYKCFEGKLLLNGSCLNTATIKTHSYFTVQQWVYSESISRLHFQSLRVNREELNGKDTGKCIFLFVSIVFIIFYLYVPLFCTFIFPVISHFSTLASAKICFRHWFQLVRL
jgi:hypothetical protein